MKRYSLLFIAAVFAIVFSFSTSANAQVDTMKKVGSDVKHGTKKVANVTADKAEDVAGETSSGAKAVYKGGKRVGYTVGTKTWNGTKWVASKSYSGGRWVAIKTKHGTKWVYHKAKHPKHTVKAM
jgi:hypothetical protein